MVAYWVAMLLLVVVLFFGTVRFGARRWFDLGFFSLQPSEFAKLAFILAQAHFLSRPVEELRALLTFWKAMGLMLLPFVLILKEPDLGSALVLLPTGLAMMFVAGMPRRYLLRLLAASACWAPCSWWTSCLRRRTGRSSWRTTSGAGCWFISEEITPPPDAAEAERAAPAQAAVR